MTRAAPPTDRPLEGIRVVVTRALHQASSTVEAFEEAGARVELLPMIEVVPPEDPVPLDRSLAALAEFDWALFTSTNTVERVLDRLGELATGRFPDSVRVAAVGSSTGMALRKHGIEPELEATDSRAEGLADLLSPRLGGGESLFLPQAADARDVLENLLLRAGGRVVRVNAYAKRVPPDGRERAEAIFGSGPLGWVTFTSPSIARNFAGLWGDAWSERRPSLQAVSIGPVTSGALRKLGVEPAAEAESPGDEEMVEAVVGVVGSAG